MIRKIVFLVVCFIFSASSVYAFQLTIKRDPFMDLLKLRELKAKEVTAIKQNKPKSAEEDRIKRMIQSVVSSITVEMVVYSKENPKMDAALIVGPSGEPIVVYKGYKLSKNVYVSAINSDGIVLSFVTKKGIKNATVKMKKE